MFGEEQQLAAAVVEFVELGPFQAVLQGGEFGIRLWSRDPAGLGEQFFQRGDF